MESSRPTGAVVIPFRKMGRKDRTDRSPFDQTILEFGDPGPAGFDFSRFTDEASFWIMCSSNNSPASQAWGIDVVHEEVLNRSQSAVPRSPDEYR